MSILAALNDGRLRLVEMLQRRDARLDFDSLPEVHSAAYATRRCVFCNAKAECEAWLASGRREGFEQFCPNAEFIGQRSHPQGQ